MLRSARIAYGSETHFTAALSRVRATCPASRICERQGGTKACLYVCDGPLSQVPPGARERARLEVRLKDAGSACFETESMRTLRIMSALTRRAYVPRGRDARGSVRWQRGRCNISACACLCEPPVGSAVGKRPPRNAGKSSPCQIYGIILVVLKPSKYIMPR